MCVPLPSAWRIVVLSDFVVDVLRRLKAAAHPGLPLVFPSSTGTLRSPNNLNREWREARGPDFAWVTRHTFRKTAATAIERDASIDDAAAQLGHSGTTVTERHYVERTRRAPDLRNILDRLGDR